MLIASAENKGTTIKVIFPRSRSVGIKDEAPSKTLEAPGAGAPQPAG
jgi:hypothetical protein